MTGAGSATVGVAEEPGFLEDPDLSTTDVWQPGKDVQIGDASLQRQLSRLRDPDSAEPIQSIAQNVEGALSATWTMTHTEWHDWVFNDGGSAFAWDRMPSTRWYLGVDYLDGTTERICKGVVVTEVSVDWNQGQNVQVQLTAIYGDEETNASVTPDTIEGGDPADVRAFHDADLEVDGTSVEKLDTFSLSISPNARFHRGASQHPVDAVIGSVEHSLSMAATYTGPSQVELAYGSSSATSIESEVDTVDATITLANAAGDSDAYALGSVQPDSVAWSDLVSSDTDLTENLEYHVASVEVA